MPLITEVKTKKGNKFKKKNYRPWDIGLSGDSDEKLFKDNELITEVVDEVKKRHAIVSKTNGNTIQKDESNFSVLELERIQRNLYGAKKDVFIYIIQQVDINNKNEVISRPITLEQLINKLGLPANTIKGALYQLKKEELLFNEEYKPGRGGYATYRINKEIYLFFEKMLKEQ